MVNHAGDRNGRVIDRVRQMFCGLHGRWPTWCVGARRLPPFGAHAWVEAEGVAVGEEYPPDYFRTFFTVP